jgi:hypothetical protein
MSIYLAEDRENSFWIGLFKNNGYLYFRRKPPSMRPDYSHKIFGDKRLYQFFFQEALARASASA